MSAVPQASSAASAGDGLPSPHKLAVDNAQHGSASEASAEDDHPKARADPGHEEGNTGGSEEDEGKQGIHLQHSSE